MKRLISPAVTTGYLALCVLLGGSSVAYGGNLLLQLLGIAILFWALAAGKPAEITPAGRELVALILLLLLIIAVQLIPLPPGLWTQLPGRDDAAEAYHLVGQLPPWLPISLAPYQTVSSSIWLLPPIAIVISFLRLGAYRRSWAAWLLIGLTIVGVLLGTRQVIGGSDWYPYRITNEGAMTGFFANSNHMATLLLVTAPFAAALFARAKRERRTDRNRAGVLIATGLAAIFILIGLAINNSLAGLALIVPVAAASLLMIRFDRRQVPGWCWLLVAAAGAASTTAALIGPLGNDLLEAKPPNQLITRYSAWPRTLQAAAEFAPFGSGIGTFVNVYPRYEDPALVDGTYMNHAHNDYLELALETGAPGLALLGAFMLWWSRRTIAVWRNSQHADAFARAATIASAAILVHSSVDYPLRMTAISALLALCCGLMSVAAPMPSSVATNRRAFRNVLHLAND
ncbi:MAG: O-antigen ligase family protein [Pseudomonadota bacterium]|nr:O-antigen ligase family protein [Pseudomonadota bacterium]